MSEEQRNQPNEQPRAGDDRAGGAYRADPGDPAAREPARESDRESDRESAEARAGGDRARPAVVGGAHEAGAHEMRAAAVTSTRSYDLHDGVGDGAPRYADAVDEIPPTGSETSWSSAPHPGYQADPQSGFDTKRLAAGTLLGCLILALGVFYGVHLLTGRSSNGFGQASWTAAVEQDGAVVGGINAQNSGSAPPVQLPPGETFGTSGAK